MGFESDRLVSITDNIGKFIDDMIKQYGSTFRFIDIKFSPTSKLVQDANQKPYINYSALLIYEI